MSKVSLVQLREDLETRSAPRAGRKAALQERLRVLIIKAHGEEEEEEGEEEGEEEVGEEEAGEEECETEST